jgi:hypothetical protein
MLGDSFFKKPFLGLGGELIEPWAAMHALPSVLTRGKPIRSQALSLGDLKDLTLPRLLGFDPSAETEPPQAQGVEDEPSATPSALTISPSKTSRDTKVSDQDLVRAPGLMGLLSLFNSSGSMATSWMPSMMASMLPSGAPNQTLKAFNPQAQLIEYDNGGKTVAASGDTGVIKTANGTVQSAFSAANTIVPGGGYSQCFTSTSYSSTRAPLKEPGSQATSPVVSKDSNSNPPYSLDREVTRTSRPVWTSSARAAAW